MESSMSSPNLQVGPVLPKQFLAAVSDLFLEDSIDEFP